MIVWKFPSCHSSTVLSLTKIMTPSIALTIILSRNCYLHRFCKLYTYYLYLVGSIAIPYNKPMHFELWLIEISDAYDNLLWLWKIFIIYKNTISFSSRQDFLTLREFPSPICYDLFLSWKPGKPKCFSWEIEDDYYIPTRSLTRDIIILPRWGNTVDAN